MKIFLLLLSAVIGTLLYITARNDVANLETVAYAYPSVVTAAAFSTTLAKYNITYNQFVHNRQLTTHDSPGSVVSPNNDTLYSSIALDLRQSPQIIELPAITSNRYQSLMATDMRAYNIAEFVNAGAGGRYLFVTRGTQGQVPAGVQLVETESDILLILIRTEVLGINDLENAHAVQNNIQQIALHTTENAAPQPDDLPALDADNLKLSVVNNWVELAQWSLKHSPKLAKADATFKANVDNLQPGLINNLMFAYGVYRLKQDGDAIQLSKGLYGSRDAVSNDHWQRAAITTATHLALSYQRASYPKLNSDDNGAPLVGCKAYTTTYQNVPVGAFWSLTVYDDDSKQFVANQQQRYRISDKTAVTDSSGKVRIHLGGNPDAENYLPLPTDCGKWYVILRLYEPTEQYLKGDWKVPPIIPAK